mmetsp:Transcript_104680/g.312669  ORF Transcript_104680/g.312669 Transcript_104680/m.312669 type:complete len:241 (+) Transcript_104680:232-954(+)
METPEPMFTTRNGKSGSGQGAGAGSPASSSEKTSRRRPPRSEARKRRPSTTAESSLTGTSSMSSASRKRGANLCAPPPAVKRRSAQPASPASSDISSSSSYPSRPPSSPRRQPRLSRRCCCTPPTALATWAVAPEKKCNRQGLPPSSNSNSRSRCVRPVAPKVSGKARRQSASPRGSAKTIFTKLPPMSTPFKPGALRIRCTTVSSCVPRSLPTPEPPGEGGMGSSFELRRVPAAWAPAS